MQSTRQRNTAAETLVRSLLHRMGLRYRIHICPIKQLHRKADIVFPRLKIAVYIDGCFWHGCPIHATWPKANAEFWRNKIESNQRRDLDTNERLREAGWTVIRAWEHEEAEEAALRIAEAVQMQRALRISGRPIR